MTKSILLAVAALLASAGPAMEASAAQPAAVRAGDYKVVAYYLGRPDSPRRFGPEKIRAGKLTHINYAFAGIQDGVMVLNPELRTYQAKSDLADLLQLKRHNAKLQILFSVGGWAGSKEFSNVALTPEARAKFADSAVTFLHDYHLDGIDIDWEFPVSGGDEGNVRRPEDKQNYTLLFRALRDKLDEAGEKDHRHYLLTAAVGNNEQFLANTEMHKVAQILDWANIMTYDFSGHWNSYAGHHSPLYDDPTLAHEGAGHTLNVDSIVGLTLKAGVPANKLVLGMPFYGYSWKQCGPSNNGQLQECHGNGRGTWEDGVLDYSDIEANLINKKGFTRYWNDHAKAPYLFNTDTGEFVTYDDQESLEYKIKYLKVHGLGGAMFWEFTGDRKLSLQNKLAHDLLGK
ncbi:MAG TPA: glycoside hydrolase family 18 protein [Burkholderiaceae bacterium]